ncbi:MAG: leucine-rich repeat protein, partial [Oscillospiraceae bacterium]|nr:leucine-rich repeat protein [Oscillospiraceae bacterium]
STVIVSPDFQPTTWCTLEVFKASGECGKNCFFNYDDSDQSNIKLDIMVMKGLLSEKNLELFNEYKEKVTSFHLHANLKQIDREFVQSFINLNEVRIQSDRIPFGMFTMMTMTKVTIGNEVKMIEGRAFEKCRGLTSVIFEEESQLTTIKN